MDLAVIKNARVHQECLAIMCLESVSDSVLLAVMERTVIKVGGYRENML